MWLNGGRGGKGTEMRWKEEMHMNDEVLHLFFFLSSASASSSLLSVHPVMHTLRGSSSDSSSFLADFLSSPQLSSSPFFHTYIDSFFPSTSRLHLPPKQKGGASPPTHPPTHHIRSLVGQLAVQM